MCFNLRQWTCNNFFHLHTTLCLLLVSGIFCFSPIFFFKSLKKSGMLNIVQACPINASLLFLVNAWECFFRFSCCPSLFLSSKYCVVHPYSCEENERCVWGRWVFSMSGLHTETCNPGGSSFPEPIFYHIPGLATRLSLLRWRGKKHSVPRCPGTFQTLVPFFSFSKPCFSAC